MSEWYEVLKGLSYKERALLKKEGVKGRYTRKKIDLSAALKDKELRVDGDTLSIAKIVGSSSITIKLDNRHAKEINLREVREIYSPYGNIYITSDGAGGSGAYVVLYFGGDLTARIKPFENKVSQRNTAGTDVDLVTDSRFTSHTGGHIARQIVADTALRAFATAKKVRWAILHTDLAIRWGFTASVHRTGPVGGFVGAEGDLTVEYCNLYDLYIINNVGAETPLVQIEYIEEA